MGAKNGRMVGLLGIAAAIAGLGSAHEHPDPTRGTPSGRFPSGPTAKDCAELRGDTWERAGCEDLPPAAAREAFRLRTGHWPEPPPEPEGNILGDTAALLAWREGGNSDSLSSWAVPAAAPARAWPGTAVAPGQGLFLYHSGLVLDSDPCGSGWDEEDSGWLGVLCDRVGGRPVWVNLFQQAQAGDIAAFAPMAALQCLSLSYNINVRGDVAALSGLLELRSLKLYDTSVRGLAGSLAGLIHLGEPYTAPGLARPGSGTGRGLFLARTNIHGPVAELQALPGLTHDWGYFTACGLSSCSVGPARVGEAGRDQCTCCVDGPFVHDEATGECYGGTPTHFVLLGGLVAAAGFGACLRRNKVRTKFPSVDASEEWPLIDAERGSLSSSRKEP